MLLSDSGVPINLELFLFRYKISTKKNKSLIERLNKIEGNIESYSTPEIVLL